MAIYSFITELVETEFDTAKKYIDPKFLEKKMEDIQASLCYYSNISLETLNQSFERINDELFGIEPTGTLSYSDAATNLENSYKKFISSNEELVFFNPEVFIISELEETGELAPNSVLRDKEILNHMFESYKILHGRLP